MALFVCGALRMINNWHHGMSFTYRNIPTDKLQTPIYLLITSLLGIASETYLSCGVLAAVPPTEVQRHVEPLLQRRLAWRRQVTHATAAVAVDTPPGRGGLGPC